MHDCAKTRDLLVDLVFDELGPEARRRTLLELEDCPDCLAQYRSMTEALRGLDRRLQAIDGADAPGGGWAGAGLVSDRLVDLATTAGREAFSRRSLCSY